MCRSLKTGEACSSARPVVRGPLPGLDTPEQLGPSAGLPGPRYPVGGSWRWRGDVGSSWDVRHPCRPWMPRAASASRGGWGAEWGGRPWFSSCGILFKPHHLPEPQSPSLLKGMLSKALTYKDEFPFPFREVCVLGPVESAVQANEHQGVSVLPQVTHHSFIHSLSHSLILQD